jgi:hypothetical protein
LYVCISRFDMIGAIAGSVAQMIGRFAANLFLLAAARSTGRGRPAPISVDQ